MMSLRSLERSEDLVVAAVYRRDIGASLERVWENVFDWEHLPWLHRSSFSAIECVDSGDWGWHARAEFPTGGQAEIELCVDREANRYVARTLAGVAAGAEIWTSLDPVKCDRTRIEVEFCVAPVPKEALEGVGGLYLDLYDRLWTEDEEMMQHRTAALAERASAAIPVADGTIDLGSLADVKRRLPIIAVLGGHSFRIVDQGGDLIAHSIVCPHMLAPLGEVAIEGGEIVCPWHGYRFDARTGRSCDGRRFHLQRAPRVEIDAEALRVMLVLAAEE